MPTPIDRAMQSRNLFLGFAGIVTAVAAYGIWGGDMFPQQEQASGDPENWNMEDMRKYLRARNLEVDLSEKREMLLARVQQVKAGLKTPK